VHNSLTCFPFFCSFFGCGIQERFVLSLEFCLKLLKLFHEVGPHTVLLGPLSDPVNITGLGLIQLVSIYLL